MEKNNNITELVFILDRRTLSCTRMHGSYGIDVDRAVNYHADKKGTKIVYDAVAEAVCSVRASRPLNTDWSEEIDKDYQGRRKR